MGCGASKGGGEKESVKAATGKDGRRKSILKEVADIEVVSGEAITLTDLPRVIFIFGMHCMFSAYTSELTARSILSL